MRISDWSSDVCSSDLAESLNGRPIDPGTTDLEEQKVLNIVEEMAIASGIPVPPVYVMEDESINAFAAGHTPQDAVIGVTRGRSEERRVGKECVSTCRSRWSPYH